MLRPQMKYQNVRADVLDILQKDSRDGEVVGPNRPRGRFGAQESTSLRQLMVSIILDGLWSATAGMT